MTSARRQKTPEEIKRYDAELEKLQAMKKSKDFRVVNVRAKPENMSFYVSFDKNKSYGSAKTVDGAIRLAEAVMACINDITG